MHHGFSPHRSTSSLRSKFSPYNTTTFCAAFPALAPAPAPAFDPFAAPFVVVITGDFIIADVGGDVEAAIVLPDVFSGLPCVGDALAIPIGLDAEGLGDVLASPIGLDAEGLGEGDALIAAMGLDAALGLDARLGLDALGLPPVGVAFPAFACAA